jgi:hypothetical protein
MSDELKKAQEGCDPDPVENWRAKPTKDLYDALDKIGPHIDSLTGDYRRLNSNLDTLRNVSIESERKQKDLDKFTNELSAVKRRLDLLHTTKGHIENALMPGLSQSRRIEEFGKADKKFNIEIDGKHYRQEAPTREKAAELAQAKHDWLHDPANKSPEEDAPEESAPQASGKKKAPRGARAQARMERAKALATATGAIVPVKVGTFKGQERYVVFDRNGNEVGVPALVDARHPEGHEQAGELKHHHQRKHEAVQQIENILSNIEGIKSLVAAKRRPTRKQREASEEARDVREAGALKTRIEDTTQDLTSPSQWDHSKNSVLRNNGHTMTPAEYRRAARMYYNAVGAPDARGEGKTAAEKTIHQFYQTKLNALRKKSPKKYPEESKPLIAERDQLLSNISSKLDARSLNEEHENLILDAATDPEWRKDIPSKILAAAEKRAKERGKSEVVKQTERLQEDLPSAETLEEKHAPMVAAVDKHFESLKGDKSFNPPVEAKAGESPSELLGREGFQERQTSDQNERETLQPWLTNKYRKLLGGEYKKSEKHPNQHFPDGGELSEFLGDDAQEAQAEWEQIQEELTEGRTAGKKRKSIDEAREELAKKWSKRFSIGRSGSPARTRVVAYMRGEKDGKSGEDLEDHIQSYAKESRDRGRTDTENANLGVLKEWVRDLKSTLGSSRKKAYKAQDIPLGESELSEEHTVFKDRYKESEAKLLEDIISRLRQSDEDTPFSVLSENGKKEIEELVRKSFDWTYGMFTKDVFPGVFLNLNLFKNFNASEKDKVRAFENSFGRDTSGVNPSTMNSEIEGREEDEDSETKKSKMDKSFRLYVGC